MSTVRIYYCKDCEIIITGIEVIPPCLICKKIMIDTGFLESVPKKKTRYNRSKQETSTG